MKQQDVKDIRRYSYTRARARVYESLIGIDRSSVLAIAIAAVLFISCVSFVFADAAADLSDANPFTRSKAAVALGKTKDSSNFTSLNNRLSVETDKSVKLYLIQALVDIRAAGTPAVLDALLSDNDADVRHKAARLLQQYGEGKPTTGLTSALNDSDDKVKAAAAVALGTEAAKNVLVGLVSDEDSKIVAQAILGLTKIHASGTDVTTAIQNALSHPNAQVKASAQWAAEMLGIEVTP